MMCEEMFWCVFLGLLCVVQAGMMGDQCDWTGSGLTSTVEQRAVTPVYLRCREGTVSWLYPRGALRLIFKPPLPSGDKDFSVCIRVIRREEPPDLFHSLDDNNLESKSERFPARLFLEGPEKLNPLYAPDDDDPREVRCFRSRKGRAALYVEAEPEEGPQRRVATFRYEARPLITRHYDPATADCRPCSDSELELAFCTSELVSRGTIVDSEQRQDLDSLQLTLSLTKVLRATGDGVKQAEDLDGTEDQLLRNAVDHNTRHHPLITHRNHKRRKDHSLHARVHISSICDASPGEGEFLVMARRRLGRYFLVCAPRVEDWIELVKKRNADGLAHCSLHY